MANNRELRHEFFFIVEGHIFQIAVLIIVLIGVLLIIYFPSDEKNGQMIFAALLTSLGTIVGFYFGQKPLSEVVSRLEDKEKQISYVSKKSNDYLELSQHFQELYEKTVEIGESLNSEKK